MFGLPLLVLFGSVVGGPPPPRPLYAARTCLHRPVRPDWVVFVRLEPSERFSHVTTNPVVNSTHTTQALVAADSEPSDAQKVEKQPPPRCFAARPEAERLAAASPLSNPNTQHTCLSVRIAQGLSESIALDLQLCRKSHVGARALEAQRMFTGLVCSPRP